MRDLKELRIKPFYERPYPSPSDADIELFEQSFGVRLPGAYVEFLKFRNGGAPRGLFVRLGRQEYGINDFYGLGARVTQPWPGHGDWDYGNLWAETPVRRSVLGCADVPFAEDGGGSIFFLDCGKEPAPVRLLVGSTRQVVDVAPSLGAFIDMLEQD